MATKKAPVGAKNKPEQNPLARFVAYVEAARAELRKVSWPTLKETRRATLVVLVFVAIMSILLGLVDLGLSSLVKTILS